MACFTSRSVIEEQRKAFMCCNVTQMPAGGVGAEGAAAQRKKRDEEEKHNKINWIFFFLQHSSSWLAPWAARRTFSSYVVHFGKSSVCLSAPVGGPGCNRWWTEAGLLRLSGQRSQQAQNSKHFSQRHRLICNVIISKLFQTGIKIKREPQKPRPPTAF